MSYHIYTSDGIILKRTPFGEANILLHILTRDLGLIISSARSARVTQSKLRSALQEYTYVSVSCIKSKNGWKITNVVEKENFFFKYPPYSQKVLAQVSFVLLKTITGESPHPEIFETIKSGFEFLQNVLEEDISNFESLIIFRILFLLGYIAKDSNTEIFLQNTTEWNKEILDNISKNKKIVISLINRAFQESHL